MNEREMAHQRERNASARSLLRVLDAHHPGEEAHAQRVAVYAVAIGQRLGLEPSDLLTLKEAALLHDVGKLSVDPELLAKKGAYTAEETASVQLHSILFSQSRRHPFMEACGPMVRHHHERWDGEGYPDGLHGDEIPLGARILAVAESFDVAANGAGWRKPLDEPAALAEIKKGAGSQFDPAVVQAFLDVQPLIQPLI